MNRNDYWEVTFYDKNPRRIPDMGKKHICNSEVEVRLYLLSANLRKVDVLVNHFVNGKQVYTKWYR